MPKISNNQAKIEVSAWERRSINYGSKLKSVLFQGMPDAANEHFHTTHLKFILDCLKDGKPTMRILDIGCGYGRLSLPLVKKFPQAQISGMDISPNYVKLYRENTGRDAFIGAIDAIPAELGTFDYIIVVTVLMYLPEERVTEVFSGLFAHLNPGGKIIIIEPSQSGLKFQTCFGLTKLLRQTKKIDTGGRSFMDAQIPTAVYRSDGIILREERIPATTFFFLPVYAAVKILPLNWTNIIFRCLTYLDNLFKNKKLPTLWSFYLLGKK